MPVTATDSAAATCTADHFCLWEDAPHDSPMASFVNGTDDTGRVGLPDGGRTAQNRTQHDWCVWSKRDYGGTKDVIHPGEWVSTPFPVYSLLPETTWRCAT
ncbi:peptidase inhibitor family I36 protein [Streptomyces lavendulae]|uniref:peptidase inhibitor family I36 protein n=1 Tax=Streptomyces lavendulae TaxID=1914 RepID=UPI0036F14C66